jgi:GTPase involved in cell partitioning and DNA repair
MFDVYRDSPYERQFFIEALSFFIDGEIEFKNGEFLINNTNIINKEIYQKILEIIAEINCLKVNKQQETYANEKARKIAEKIQQAKQKRSSVQSKDSTSLADIISAVASRKESLNLLNIWDLTIYQLYDHYNRLIAEDEFDIHAMNYAYWGGEFKCKHWSKQLDY